jgi:hypothetical protein
MAKTDLGSAAHAHIFFEPDKQVFAVLDGASVPGLLEALQQHGTEHVCLYRGDLTADLAETAPYLVRLDPGKEFAQWVLTQGWGEHWGIYAVASVDLRELRKHFRTFLIVKSYDGRRLYFRYYDPRVLRVYLPTCTVKETRAIFGPVMCYCLEDEDGARLLRFRPGQEGSRKEEIPLGPAPEQPRRS